MWAMGACLDKKTKYPENPLTKKKEDIKEIAKNSGKSEAQMQQELLYMQLQVMKANSDLNKLDEQLSDGHIEDK